MVTRSTGGHLHYLLLTDGGVFNLTLVREKEDYPFCKSMWVLRYRVKDDVPAKKESHGFSNVIPLYPVNRSNNSSPLPQGTSKLMAVPVPLLNIVYYHGHLCPELAVGYRVGLVAQKELGLTRETAKDFFVLAENMTSAIDALQFMTGCTIGNQNFFAYDLGKHVYYFGSFPAGSEPRQEALRVALINPIVDLSCQGEIEKRIVAGRASAADLEEYQQAIDDAVREILSIPDESLFVKSRVSLRPPQTACRRDYIKCSCCGEVVAVQKTVVGEDELLCQVCAARKIV